MEKKNNKLIDELNFSYDEQNSKDINNNLNDKKTNFSLSEDISIKDEKKVTEKSFDLKIEINQNNKENEKYNTDLQKINNIKDNSLMPNRNMKMSIMTNMVQEQINESFSLDNLGKINLAKEHRSANRPLCKKNEFNKDTKFCPCCNLPCQQKDTIELFSYCENIKNFAICGKGIYLYFFYISFAIFCFLIISIISSISYIFLNYTYSKNVHNICNINENSNDFLNISKKCVNYINRNSQNESEFVFYYNLSIYNMYAYKDICNNIMINKNNCKKSIVNYSIINFLTMITLLVFNILYLTIFHYRNNELKEGILPSDYTLLITNLDNYYKDFKKNNLNEIYNTEKFESYLKEQLFGGNKKKSNMIDKIHSINLCYQMDEYMEIQKKCEEYKYKIFQIRYNPYQKKKNEIFKYKDNEQCYFLMPFTFFGCLFSIKKGENLDNLNLKKKLKEAELINSMEHGKKLEKFAGRIFVTFNTVQDKDKYYNKFPHYFIEKIFYYFNNIKYFFFCFYDEKKKKKFLLRQKINVYHANEPEDIIWENMEYSTIHRILRKLLIYFISFLLLVILFIIVLKLTVLQNDLLAEKSKTWNIISINLVSYSISLFILIVNKIFQLLLELLTKIEKPNSYSDFNLSCSLKLTMFAFATKGLIPAFCNYLKKNDKLFLKNTANLFFINAITLPIPFKLIIYFYKKIRIWLIEQNNKKGKQYKTQKELNEIYELPDMDISYKYSDITQTILINFFYMPIFPSGPIISAIGLILTYMGQKFYFIHFYKRPEMLNEKICKFYLEYFTINLFIYSISDYIFTGNIFNIIIFSILAILPYNKFILLYLDKKKIFEKNILPISEVYFHFYNDYERQNPITKKEGLCKYITKLGEKGIISKNLEKIAKNNIENINIMEVYYKSSLRHNLMKSQMAFTNKKENSKKKKKKRDNILHSDTNFDLKNNNKEGKKENINNEKQDNSNNIGQNINHEEIDEEHIIDIFKGNKSFMFELYKTPHLLEINDSIRISMNNFDNPKMDNDNFSKRKNINNQDKNELDQFNNPKNIHLKSINEIEESKEEEKEFSIKNKLSHLNTNWNGLLNKKSVFNSEIMDDTHNFSKKSHLEYKKGKNLFYKNINFNNNQNIFNEFESNSNLNEEVNLEEIKFSKNYK